MGTEELWPYLLALSGVPAVLQFVTLQFFPEAPRYLYIDKGDTEGAKQGDYKNPAWFSAAYICNWRWQKSESRWLLFFVTRVWKLCSGCGRRTTLRWSWRTCRKSGKARGERRQRRWGTLSPLAASDGRFWRWPCPAAAFSSVESTPYVRLHADTDGSMSDINTVFCSFVQLYFYAFDIFHESGVPENQTQHLALGIGATELTAVALCVSVSLKDQKKCKRVWSVWSCMDSAVASFQRMLLMGPKKYTSSLGQQL